MTASNEQQPASNELDQALQAMREDMNDAKRQSNFYDIFLNTTLDRKSTRLNSSH